MARQMNTQSQGFESRRQQIIDKAQILFWNHGYERTTMKDIAKACGFEPANIYNYFVSKEEVLFTSILDSHLQILDTIKSLDDDRVSPTERLRRAIGVHASIALGPRTPAGLIFEGGVKHLGPSYKKEIIKLRDEYEGILLNILEEGMRKGEFASDINAKLSVYFICSVVNQSRLWFSQKGPLSSIEVADVILKFLLRAIGARTVDDALSQQDE